MATLPDSAKELIESGALAHLVTSNADGSAQVSIIWVGIDAEGLVSAHLDPRQRKQVNIRRDPRVVLSFEATTSNGVGLRDNLVVHATALITEGGAAQLLQRLAQAYVGPGTKFQPMADPPPGVIVRYTVDRVGGQGPWMAPAQWNP
jgi:PPOX class probable F420-dependent enzyme